MWKTTIELWTETDPKLPHASETFSVLNHCIMQLNGEGFCANADVVEVKDADVPRDVREWFGGDDLGPWEEEADDDHGGDET